MKKFLKSFIWFVFDVFKYFIVSYIEVLACLSGLVIGAWVWSEKLEPFIVKKLKIKKN